MEGSKRVKKEKKIFSPDDYHVPPVKRKGKKNTANMCPGRRQHNVKAEGYKDTVSKWDIYTTQFNRLVQKLRKCLYYHDIQTQQHASNATASAALSGSGDSAHFQLNVSWRNIILLKLQIRYLIARAIAENGTDARYPELAADEEGGMVDIEHILCSRCGKTDECGNDILLCDRVGCNRAYHQKCLDVPIDLAPEQSEEEGEGNCTSAASTSNMGKGKGKGSKEPVVPTTNPNDTWFCWQCEFLDISFARLTEETEYCDSVLAQGSNGGGGVGTDRDINSLDDVFVEVAHLEITRDEAMEHRLTLPSVGDSSASGSGGLGTPSRATISKGTSAADLDSPLPAEDSKGCTITITNKVTGKVFKVPSSAPSGLNSARNPAVKASVEELIEESRCPSLGAGALGVDDLDDDEDDEDFEGNSDSGSDSGSVAGSGIGSSSGDDSGSESDSEGDSSGADVEFVDEIDGEELKLLQAEGGLEASEIQNLMGANSDKGGHGMRLRRLQRGQAGADIRQEPCKGNGFLVGSIVGKVKAGHIVLGSVVHFSPVGRGFTEPSSAAAAATDDSVGSDSWWAVSFRGHAESSSSSTTASSSTSASQHDCASIVWWSLDELRGGLKLASEYDRVARVAKTKAVLGEQWRGNGGNDYDGGEEDLTSIGIFESNIVNTKRRRRDVDYAALNTQLFGSAGTGEHCAFLDD